MNILSLDKWKDYYNKNKKFPDFSYINPKKKYSDKEIELRYNKYKERIQKQLKNQEQKRQENYDKQFEKYILELIKRMDSDEPIIDDPKWQKLLDEIKKRDNNKCRLITILTKEEKEILFNNAPEFLLNRLEGAHCISRARSKNLYYNIENVYLLNCFSHRNLDSYRCPLTGKPITKDEVEKWWVRIVGEKTFEWLKENK